MQPTAGGITGQTFFSLTQPTRTGKVRQLPNCVNLTTVSTGRIRCYPCHRIERFERFYYPLGRVYPYLPNGPIRTDKGPIILARWRPGPRISGDPPSLLNASVHLHSKGLYTMTSI